MQDNDIYLCKVVSQKSLGVCKVYCASIELVMTSGKMIYDPVLTEIGCAGDMCQRFILDQICSYFIMSAFTLKLQIVFIYFCNKNIQDKYLSPLRPLHVLIPCIHLATPSVVLTFSIVYCPLSLLLRTT